MANQYSGDLTAAIMTAAASPAGLRTDAVAGYSTHQVSQLANKMVRDGKLFRAKISHRVVRYFTTESAAKALEMKTAGVGVMVRDRVVKGSAWESMQRTETVETILTQCPTYEDDRFIPAPDDESWKLFSSLRPGQYIAPASNWVRALEAA